jgi:signal transduction histidine kinase
MNSPQDSSPLFHTILRWFFEFTEINARSEEDRAQGQKLIWYATITVIIVVLALGAIAALGFTDNIPPEYRVRSIAMIMLGFLMSMMIVFPVLRSGRIMLATWLWLGAAALVPAGAVIVAPAIYSSALPAILMAISILGALVLSWRQSLALGLLLSAAAPVSSQLLPDTSLTFANGLITGFLMLAVVSVTTLHCALAQASPPVTPRDWLRDLESRSLGHRLDSLNTQIASRAHRVAQTAGDNLSPECRSEVEEILRLSANIGEELDSAVDRATLVQGEIVPSASVIDPTHILHAVISRYNDQARERGLRFRCFAHPFLPQVVRIDSLLVRRAIMNVVDNAIRFTDDGGEVGIEALHIDARRWIIEVNDSGQGMADDTRIEIMRKLELGEDIGDAKEGLSIAYEIVRILGGTMSIDSSESKGTTVTMILPVQQRL